jgi:hypothetical protein
MFRSIYTSAVRHSSKPHAITIKFPVTLRISLPEYGKPVSLRFTSFDNIADFLKPKSFFVDPSSGTTVQIDQVEDLDPGVVYDVYGPGWTHRQKGLSREQVVDRVFENKAAMALKAILQKEAGGFVELPRVIQDEKGKDVAEWEAVLELPDGCVVFLEVKFCMSMVGIYYIFVSLCTKYYQAHINKQPERMSKSLRAMGKNSRVKLFLAGYYWHDDKTCIEFTRSQGYGIIKPNGRDLDVEVMAVGMCT